LPDIGSCDFEFKMKLFLILTLCLTVSFGSVLKRQTDEGTISPAPVKQNDESTTSDPTKLNDQSTTISSSLDSIANIKVNDKPTTPAKLSDKSTAPAIPDPTKCPPKPDAAEELDLERVIKALIF
jgi:hypothetical protein